MSRAAAANELAEPERTILETLRESEDAIERRVELADVIDESYPPVERALQERDLLKEVGKVGTHNDAGERVVYRRLSLTEEGERVLSWTGRDESAEQDPVEPRTRPKRREPWHKRAEWTALSEQVNRLVEETQSVAFDSDDEEIAVTLDRDGREATISFNKVAWFNTGHRKFHEEFHAAFNERNPIDEREFGILQARWVDMAEAAVEDDDLTAKERAKQYLAGPGSDDSVRQAAEQLGVSVGTVQSAKQELNSDE